MCGIGGIKRMGKAPILPLHISQLASGIQHRGLDATGIALQQKDGTVAVYKAPIPAWSFVRGDAFEKFLKDNLNDDTETALVHTRAATQGPPHRNENNHPLHKKGAAVIHNGVISNDDELFKAKEFKRVAETDSDILRAIVDTHGMDKKAVRQLARVRGTVASAIVDPRYPGMLLLLRSDNPLVIASTEEFVAFASEKQALYKLLRPWVKRFGVWMQVQKPDIAFITMPNNSAWMWGPEGFLWHQEYEVGGVKTDWRGKTLPIVRDYKAHDTYRFKKEKATREEREEKTARERAEPITVNAEGNMPEYVICPNKECDRVLHLAANLRKLSPDQVFCNYCKCFLDGAFEDGAKA